MAVLFSTSNNNSYLYNLKLKEFYLLHPLMVLLYQYMENNEIVGLKRIRENGVEIDRIYYNPEDVLFYETKINNFKKNYKNRIQKNVTFNGRFNKNLVDNAIANTQQIVFEVTESCNLKCEYCGYGDYYIKDEKRNNKKLDETAAISFLKYIIKRLNSTQNGSINDDLLVGFYGGEPLINFKFIKEIVSFCEQQELLDKKISYQITTNGTLLNRYIEFLVQHNFKIAISIDGTRLQNKFRIFKNGKESFDIVYNNIKILQKKYPKYFREKVKFQSVLNINTDLKKMYEFFEEFGKSDQVSTLDISDHYVSKEKKEQLANIKYKSNSKKTNFELNLGEVSIFSLQYFKNAFSHYYDLLNDFENIDYLPSATCIPFEKKVFITAEGKILPCERISYNYELGRINEEIIYLDPSHIANLYNEMYDNLERKICNFCAIRENCTKCMFQFDYSKKSKLCDDFVPKEKFSKYLSKYLTAFENNPGWYQQVVNEIKIDE